MEEHQYFTSLWHQNHNTLDREDGFNAFSNTNHLYLKYENIMSL